MSIIKEYQDNGWTFKWEPETMFIGIYHPQGGKQSLCEIRSLQRDRFGKDLEAILNAKPLDEQAIRSDERRKCADRVEKYIDDNGGLYNGGGWDEAITLASAIDAIMAGGE